MSVGLSRCVLGVILGRRAALRVGTAPLTSRLSWRLVEGRGRRSLRRRLRTMPAEVVFRKRRALACRPAGLRRGRTSVEGRWPTKLRWGGLRPVSPSHASLFFVSGRAQPGPCQVAGEASNPVGAA